MDILKRSWIDGEVVAQLKNLLAARKTLYSDTKSKKPGSSKSLEVLITRESSVGLGGELLISRKMINLPPLQIKKVLIKNIIPTTWRIQTDSTIPDFE